MKILIPPNKLNNKTNGYYSLNAEERLKYMNGAISQLEKSTSTYKTREYELNKLRGKTQ
jgi:hypothetical protein